ncbi:hypothetical protein [Dyella mobilis]|uniref:Uncharacterized protein n=1 Tax=Dyella mobilis TaxID=1849582 RepID=A0ABS2KN03_9GAMM|nr:hypothetical protein [Dyella mobilis]MBM7132268.1 hypothetical protein [Dyella mobilis]GLQ95747.1 hypothetical protein GCM10007863_01650 [Dyella mobilis]
MSDEVLLIPVTDCDGGGTSAASRGSLVFKELNEGEFFREGYAFGGCNAQVSARTPGSAFR